MNKPRSRLAVASLVLGLVGCWFVLLRAPFLLVLAIPLGIVTLLCGLAAAWKISRRNTVVRGRGMAIAGICLGAAASLFGTVALVIVVAQEFPPKTFQHDHDYRHRHAEFSRSPMRDVPATNFTSNLPIVVLETDGRYVSKESRSFVRTRFYDAKSGGRAALSSDPDHAGFGTINLRGHSTLGLPKPSYTFHVTDERTNQVKVPLLGLPAEEDWILYAPFEDKSMMRDVLAYELARRMGHYAPRTRYIELFVQNSSDDDDAVSMRDYMGVYVLIERIKRGKDRVNIAKLDEDDKDEPAISGGYIVKRDHGEGGGGRFRTPRGGPFFYIYPKSRDITSAQKTWLRDYFSALEETLYSENFADPREGYAAYLDVGAFIDSHWLIELSKNVDGFRYSAYLSKDRGKKLAPGPAWDWNRAFGNANYYGGGQVRGWYWTVLRPNEICWHQRLREDPAYVQRAAKRWVELRKNVLDPKKISALIDQYAAELKEAQERNFER